MTYEELVQRVRDAVELADATNIREHLAVQFNITGDANGVFYLEVKDGRADVQPYDYHDRDIIVTSSAENLLDIIEGRTDVVSAFLNGQIQAEGDLGRASDIKRILEKSSRTERV